MKEEVLAAVAFLMRFVEKSDNFPSEQLENFKTHLTALLLQRFEKHWFPEIPAKGQGYRCIRMNILTPMDKSIELAASKCGFSYRDLSLPTELTLWVDPSEVCYRLGESEGSYCTLATFPSETSSLASSEYSNSSTPLSTPPSTPTQEKSSPKVQILHQQWVSSSIDGTTSKYRKLVNSSAVSPVRSKPMSQEVSFNYPQYPPWRCDMGPYSLPQGGSYNRNYNNNYNTRQYKNVLKV